MTEVPRQSAQTVGGLRYEDAGSCPSREGALSWERYGKGAGT